MRFDLKRRIYESLPGPVRAPVGWLPFGWLAGRSYRTALRRGARLDRAPREELEAWQARALGELLAFACDQVPAYQPLRRVVARLAPMEALKAFPLLDKRTLQEDLPRYLPRDFACLPHYECSTGGTSGNQLRLYLDNDSQSVEMAFMHRQWARVGYRPRCRKAMFRGVDFPRLRPGRYWQANPIYNELQFSPYHMNEETLGLYWQELLRYRPAFLHGYPSAIALLAGYLRRRGLPGERLGLRAALLGSEGLLPEQRALIEEVFRTRAYSWYGHSERVILAGECERSNAYHHFPDYGVLEIVKAGDGAPAEPGETGELVGTGLLNRSLPLIRYRTEDRARRLDWRCPCGRAFDRFDEVEGRWEQDCVIGRNGSRISLAALNIHGPCFENVIRYQYYQEAPGKVELRAMITERFSAADEAALHEAYRRKVGDELDIAIRAVPDIPLTARGKFRRLTRENS